MPLQDAIGVRKTIASHIILFSGVIYLKNKLQEKANHLLIGILRLTHLICQPRKKLHKEYTVAYYEITEKTENKKIQIYITLTTPHRGCR